MSDELSNPRQTAGLLRQVGTAMIGLPFNLNATARFLMDVAFLVEQQDERIKQQSLASLREPVPEVELKRAIAVVRSGKFCHLSDHMQDICDCEQIAELFEALLTPPPTESSTAAEAERTRVAES